MEHNPIIGVSTKVKKKMVRGICGVWSWWLCSVKHRVISKWGVRQKERCTLFVLIMRNAYLSRAASFSACEGFARAPHQ